MQRITISLPDNLHERLIELGDESGPYDSKSEAVRGLIHDLEDETARQLRRYRNGAWKTTEAVFPSRQSDRVSKTSVRRMVKKAATVADIRPYVASAGRGDPTDVSPHTFRHSIAFRMIRREDKRLEDVMLRLRHSSLQTSDQIYGHLRRR